MSKYHINNEGKIGVCRATKRPCKFGGRGEHFENKKDALKAYEIKMKLKESNGKQMRSLKPILLKPTSISPPENWNNYIRLPKITNPNKTINSKKLLKEIIGQELNKDNEVLLKVIKNFNGVKVEKSYGEEVKINDKLLKALKKEYYSMDNAVDDLGVLEHVREKGFQTKGLAPVDAIKKMLREENNKYIPFVENCKNITVKNLNFEDIKKAERHFERIEPAKPVAKSKNSQEFMGVIFEVPGKEFRLLDGHHRVKHQMLNNRRNGEFIVLLP